MEILKENAKLIDANLEKIFAKYDDEYKILFDSMKYSAMGGGKRVRPCITIEVCKMLSGNTDAAIDLACALELVHTYSLIHDDLPCMDNDDFRRGVPTNHKKFGEATAMLAGDALLTLAFEVISDSKYLSDSAKIEAVKALSFAAGAFGMIGGQQMDLLGETQKLSSAEHNKMNLLKTGALIKCAGKLGCIASDTDEETTEKVETYCENIGIAFQVRDDILDDGSEDEKTTYLTFMSAEKAEDYVISLTNTAVSAIENFDKKDSLVSLARMLETRTK